MGAVTRESPPGLIAEIEKENMTTNTFVEINLPEAGHLADLTGIYIDLASAWSLAQFLRELFDSKKPDLTLVDPLSIAILVRYSRAFVNGVRRGLGQEARKVLTKQQWDKHQRLREFRDKHIAHSVNAFEENQVVARYSVERVNEEGVTSVECNHARVTGLSSADIEDVIDLTTVLLAYVVSRLEQEKSKVLEIVRRIPIKDVLSYRRKGSQLLDMRKINKARKK